jgi:uncharacterized protein YgbK (DUF1537 family)
MVTKSDLFASLPAEWPDDLLPAIQRRITQSGRKLVVLDDDPTGTQTVHSIPVLTEWSVDSLRAELADDGPCFYILTNSRSLTLPDAQTLNAEVGRNLRAASADTGRAFAVVSRSDSTLRGHFPGEVDSLVDSLETDFDAWLIIPYFLEGRRYTINDVHYVADGDHLIPAGETPYAQDASFGYVASNLREWVAEKTGGRFSAADVATITLDDLRVGGPERVVEKLLSLPRGVMCVVNSVSYRDQEVFVAGLLAAEAQGKRYVYRTAASFVRVRAGIAPKPLLTQADLNLPESGGGLFVVGSYVPKTTSQLDTLLDQTDTVAVELSVRALLDGTMRNGEIARAAKAADEVLAQDQDVAIFTSRDLITGHDAASSLAIGRSVSDGLIATMRAIQTQPRYLVGKGGITSSDIATKGLDVKKAAVMGQILPGVPVWQLGPGSRYPNSAYIVFPGNVGDADSLAVIQSKFKVAALGQPNPLL